MLMNYTILLTLAAIALPQESAQSLEGVWQSEAYGQVIRITPDAYEIYDTTPVSCVRADNGKAADFPKVFPELTYLDGNAFQVSGLYYRYRFRRMDALPEACREPAAIDPVLVFDAFWHYLDDHYAFFDRRGIDWAQARAEFRPRVNSATTQKELYGILGELVGRINDPHVFVSNGARGDDNLSAGAASLHGIALALQEAVPGQPQSAYRDGAGRIIGAIEAVVRYELLATKFKVAFNDRLTWGRLPNGVAFLRASQFVGLFSNVPREAMQERLDATLDEIFRDLEGAPGLVIDLSTNAGGADFIPVAIARRLIDRRVLGFRKYAMSGGRRIAPYELWLEPSTRPRFLGPVAVLVSRNSISSGETLPNMLRQLPHVTIVGEQTVGAMSDILMKQLPGGGFVGLSNEIVESPTGEISEVFGIVPEHRVTVFDGRAPISSYMRAVASAVEVLRAGRR